MRLSVGLRALDLSGQLNAVKSVIAYLLKLRAGECPTRPAWFAHKYIAYAEQVTLKGSFQKFSQLVQVWRIFTSLGEVRDTPLPQDVEKFERAVLSTIPDQVFVIPYKGDRNHPRAYIPLSTLRIRKPVRKLLPEVVLPPVIPVRNPLALRVWYHGYRLLSSPTGR